MALIPIDKKDALSASVIDFVANCEHLVERYNKKRNIIFRDTASLDEDGNFFLDKNGKPDFYKVSKANMEQRELKLDKLLIEEVELEPCITNDTRRVLGLPYDVIKLYNGWLWNIDLQNDIKNEE